MKIGSFPALIGLLCIAVVPTTSASAIALCGPNVCYQYDDAQPGLAWFGLPALIGDAIRFLPPAFAASLSNGGTVLTSATFLFDRVYGAAGGEVASVTVSGGGDYAIFGSGSVAATLALAARDNQFDGVGPPLAFPEMATGASSFSATASTAGVQLWNLGASVDPAASFVDPASDVSLQISTDISAVAEGSGDFAFIQQKFLVSTATVTALTAVTEPGTAALLLMGLIGLMRVHSVREKCARPVDPAQ
jgi:hypothetical protein